MTDNTTLTQSMQPVVEAIGFDAAERLVIDFGGRRLFIAADPDARGKLALSIGLERARELARAIGAGVFEVPRCLGWVNSRRNEEICVRSLGGESHSELARCYGLSERRIRSILAAARATTESTT